MWFKMKHEKTTCDANRPKDLREYDSEVPERLREILVLSGIAPDAAFGHGSSPEEEFVDSTDWETEFFSELEPEKIFSSPGTLQSLPRETRTPFTTLVKDPVSLA